jgi:ankyrin repeat protein
MANANKALHTAVASDDARAIEAALAAGADVEHSRAGVTPLAYACMKGKTAAVRTLLASGANVHARSTALHAPGATPLLLAAMGGHAHAMRAVLDAGASMSDACDDGVNLLHALASLEDGIVSAATVAAVAEVVKVAAAAAPGAAGQLLHEADVAGDTPLHVAATQAGADVVKLLLQLDKAAAEADPAAYGNSALWVVSGAAAGSQLPLHAAMARPREYAATAPRIVDALLVAIPSAQRARMLAATDAAGATPMHVGARSGPEGVLRVACERVPGASLPALFATRDADGRAPIHVAAHSCQPVQLGELVAAGADVWQLDASGRLPLHLVAASEAGSDDAAAACVRTLLAAADRGATELRSVGTMLALRFDGKTALHMAAGTATGSPQVVLELLERGARATATCTSRAWMPLHYVAAVKADRLPEGDDKPMADKMRGEVAAVLLQRASAADRHAMLTAQVVAQAQSVESAAKMPVKCLLTALRMAAATGNVGTARAVLAATKAAMAAGDAPPAVAGGKYGAASTNVPAAGLSTSAPPLALDHMALHNCRTAAAFSAMVAAGLRPALARAASGKTPLHHFAGAGLVIDDARRRDLIAAAVAAGISPNAVDAAGNTPVHDAAEAGDADAIVQLRRAGGNAAAVNAAGMTPLMASASAVAAARATMAHKPDAAAALVSALLPEAVADSSAVGAPGAAARAYVNAVDAAGLTALSHAAASLNKATLSAQAPDGKAQAQSPNAAGGSTGAAGGAAPGSASKAAPAASSEAASLRVAYFVQLITTLLDAGATPRGQRYSHAQRVHAPTLHAAVRARQWELTRRLLGAGADPLEEDSDGKLALRVLLEGLPQLGGEAGPVFAALIPTQPALVNATASPGALLDVPTYVSLAVEARSAPWVCALLAAGADPSVKSERPGASLETDLGQVLAGKLGAPAPTPYERVAAAAYAAAAAGGGVSDGGATAMLCAMVEAGHGRGVKQQYGDGSLQPRDIMAAALLDGHIGLATALACSGYPCTASWALTELTAGHAAKLKRALTWGRRRQLMLFAAANGVTDAAGDEEK